MINNIKIEICIGNVEDALKASQYPIDRIELNSALELGGHRGHAACRAGARRTDVAA